MIELTIEEDSLAWVLKEYVLNGSEVCRKNIIDGCICLSKRIKVLENPLAIEFALRSSKLYFEEDIRMDDN